MSAALDADQAAHEVDAGRSAQAADQFGAAWLATMLGEAS